MFAIENDTFDPVLLSLEENAFLLEHLGKPPKVVERVAFPAGVNRTAVLPIIEEIYGLEEIAKHDKQDWTGIDRLKTQIQTYLDQREGWRQMKVRAGKEFPSFPTMASWDARGKPHMGAVGSDSQRVRTYFDADGNRQLFAISLHDTGVGAFVPPWVKADASFTELIVDEEKSSLRCPICDHSETWQAESQSSKNLASGRMAKHLVSAKVQPNQHKALHTAVYGH